VRYTEAIPEYGDVMTVSDFREACGQKHFIDYDGIGRPAKGGKMMRKDIKPSDLPSIPADATHIVWFNR